MSVVTALLRVAPVATSVELMEPESVRHCEMLERGGFKPLPGKTIPVCLDHEKDRVIGRVESTFYNECWTGGTWLFALAHLDEVPDWLERDRAVSIAHATTFRRTMPGGWDLLTRGLITEISVLSPGQKPAHPLARVMTVTRSPAAGSVATSYRPSSPAKYDDMLSRYGYTDGDVEQFVTAAQRTELDKLLRRAPDLEGSCWHAAG